MPKPRLVPLIANLPAVTPFVGPEALERRMGRPFSARIGANESVFGPSPKAVAAMNRAAAESWMYGDPEQYELKAALAAHHGVGSENIAIDSGVDALLGLVVRMTVEPGDPVVVSLGGYPTFIFHVDGHGGRRVHVPYRGDYEDAEGLIEATRRERAPLVYIANPNNPMGTWWGADQMQAMIDAVPDGSLLILDEAYVDMAPTGTAPPIDVSNPCVLRMRTFSKAYGMAGVRVGYCIGEAGIIAAFDKIRNHFDVSRIAQAGAVAALADQGYLSDVLGRISRARDEIGRIATANQLRPLESATNFVAIDLRRDGAFARRVLDELGRRGVFVRMPGVAPLDRCIRVSAGTQTDLSLLEAMLPPALAAAAT